MPTKREWSPTTKKSSRTKRSKHKKTQLTTVIAAEARQQQRDTIRALLPREQTQVICRDKEFRKFLLEQYRLYCPELKCDYRQVSSAVMADCTDWIRDFKGVNKKTEDALTVDRRFDLTEGRSWVDQRRSKKIIPLFVSWLDKICETARRMQEKNSSLPSDLEVIMVEKLLTTSYHPQSSQSNQTLLVCQQSLHTKQMRTRLKRFDIIVPESKKHLANFIGQLRNKVENRRLGFSVGADSQYSDSIRSDDSDCDVGSGTPSLIFTSPSDVSSHQSVIMAKDAELAELRKKYELMMDENRQLRAQYLVAQQRVTSYEQEISMMRGFAAAWTGFGPSADKFSSSASCTSSPLSGWGESTFFSSDRELQSNSFFPPAVETETRSDSSPSVFDGADYMMMDRVDGDYSMTDVPTRLANGQMETCNRFLNWSTFGF